MSCQHCHRRLKKNPRLKGKQRYCGSPSCQQARKNKWERKKLKADAHYKARRLAYREQWYSRYPGDKYQSTYRQAHPEYMVGNREKQRKRGKKITGKKKLWRALHNFFKEAKGLLGLGKCQSNDFDAQIADATITMIQHILITLRYRYEQYDTISGLFSQIRDSATRQRLNQRLWGLFVELLQIIKTIFEDIDDQLLLERIFHDDQAFERIARLLEGSDSINAAA